MSELYTVEKVYGKRKNSKGIVEYQVKWLNYPYEQCTWQPYKNLKYVSQLVDEYEASLKKGKPGAMSTGMSRKSGKSPVKGSNGRRVSESQDEDESPIDIKNYRAQEVFEDQSEEIEEEVVKPKKKKMGKNPQEEPKRTKKFKKNVVDSDEDQLEQQTKEEKINFNRRGPKNPFPRKEATEKGNAKLKRIPKSIPRIVEMAKDQDGDYIYFTQQANGLQSYKTRQYIFDNFPQELIRFYESKIEFAGLNQSSGDEN